MTYVHSMNERFNKFAIRATVIVVAMALHAQAKIIYHSADITINDGTYNLDLNHDGITDFTISARNHTACPGLSGVVESPAPGNGALFGRLNLGQQIGGDALDSAPQDLAFVYWNKLLTACLPFSKGGSWLPAIGASVDGYLGLSLQIDGQTLYGWVRLTVQHPTLATFSATVRGYAYETTPYMPIGAGETAYVQFIPSTLQFGKVPVGSGVSGSVILMNWLTTTVLINNASLTGINSPDFTSGNNPPCGGSLAPGTSCTLKFTFTPSVAGNETAVYSVYDDAGGSPKRLPLKGTGQ